MKTTITLILVGILLLVPGLGAQESSEEKSLEVLLLQKSLIEKEIELKKTQIALGQAQFQLLQRRLPQLQNEVNDLEKQLGLALQRILAAEAKIEAEKAAPKKPGKNK